MTSASQMINSAISPILQGYIFPEIVKLAGQRGNGLSVEDLTRHFSSLGFDDAPAASEKTATTRSRAPRGAAAAGGRVCEYLLSRGARKGEKCGNTVKDGNKFCTGCSKKKGVMKGESGGSNGKSSKPVSSSNFSPSESSNGSMSAKKWPGSDALYPTTEILYVMEYRCLVYQSDAGVFVIGKCQDETGKFPRVPLTDADEKDFIDKGFNVDPKAKQPTPAATTASAPFQSPVPGGISPFAQKPPGLNTSALEALLK